jgi:hypothetical protein
MATSRKTTAAAATEPTPSDGTISPIEPVPTPTVTYYQQLAGEFLTELDEIAAIVPKLVEAQQASTANFVRTHLNVSTEFIATVIAAVEQTPELQGVGRLDVTAARDTLQLIEAFRTVLDKVTAFTSSLQYTMNSRKASLVVDSLQMYDIAKALARDPNNAAIRSHVANMKRDLGRRGRPKATTLARRAAAADAAAQA